MWQRYAGALLLLCFASGHAEVIRIAVYDVEISPYVMGEGPVLLHPPGQAVEMANQVAAELGYTLVWQRLPSRRLLSDLAAGRIDATLILSYSTERARWYAYPMKAPDQPDTDHCIAQLAYALYRRKGSMAFWDGHQFKGLSGPVGVNAGFSSAELLQQLGTSIDEAKDTTQNFAKLLAGRVQLVVAHETAGDYLLAEHHFSGIEKLPQPLVRKPYYTVFSKAFAAQHPKVVGDFWDALRRIRGSYSTCQ